MTYEIDIEFPSKWCWRHLRKCSKGIIVLSPDGMDQIQVIELMNKFRDLGCVVTIRDDNNA